MQSRASEMSGLTTVVDRIRYWASTHPEREAFVFRRHDGSRFPLSRAAYLHLATRFAARLQSLGLQHGDVVCNFLVNSPERLVTDLGIMLSGAVPMNGAPLLADGADVKGCLQKGRAKALIVDPEQKDGAWDVCQKVLHPCQAGPYQSSDLPDLKQVLFSRRSEQGDLLLFEELEASTEQFQPVTTKTDDGVYIFTTSGSTGFSKLVLHTNGSVLRMFRDIAAFKRTDENSVLWHSSSLGWQGGFPQFCYATGAKRVLQDVRSGTPPDLMEFLWTSFIEEKVTTACIFPYLLDGLLKRPELWRGRHELERVMSAGQPVSKNVLKALSSSGGFVKIFSLAFGCTEVGYTAIADFRKEEEFENFLVGQVANEIQVKIGDEQDKEVPTGTRGQLLLMSPHMFKGYIGDDEANRKSLTDEGWFRTNDLAYVDDKGRLYVMGRQSDAIMRGPFIVVPQWLEVRIRLCPGVEEVVVVPVPDEVMYNEVCACVIRKKGSDVKEEDVANNCKTLFLSDASQEKVPLPKYYLLLEEFPRNRNDKTDRKQLAKMAAEKFGLM